MSSGSAARARPTPGSERIALLDALRGFALVGILLMNLGDFSGYFLLTDPERAALATAPIDGPLQIALGALFHGKFYTIFSLLFGLGLALQLSRGASAGTLLRRYAWLFVFGLVHMVVIWPGDILAPYAVAGVVLLALSRLPDRVLLATAAVLFLAPVAMHWLYLRLGLDPRAAILAVSERFIDGGTGAGEIVRRQLMNPVYRLANLLGENRLFKILAAFALGMWIGRRGLHLDPDAHRPLLRRVLVGGLAVGLPCSIALELVSQEQWFPATALGLRQSVLYTAGVAPLALGWVAAFALLWTTPAWRRRLAVFAPAGRMALTNYLMQSVLCAPIFLLAATRTTPTMGPTLWLPVTVAIIALQVTLSRRWLAAHAQGPLERVWRRLTYGR